MILHNLDVAIALAVVMLAVSLLITIFTQAVSTGLATRGRTLRDTLTILLNTLEAAPDGKGREIANQILTHPLISDSAVPAFLAKIPVLKIYRLATAVRVEELIGIVETATSPRNAAAVLLKVDEIRKWFDGAMDRASQKFILQTRLITIVCSIVVAFALHLDTFRLLSQVSADSQLRAGLVNAAQAMQTQAAAVFKAPPDEKPSGKAEGSEQPIKVPSIYQTALKTTVEAWKDKSQDWAKGGGDIPIHVPNRETGEQWLRKKIGNDPKVRDEAVAYYELTIDKGLTSNTDRLLDHAASVQGALDEAAFKLIPDPYHGWDFWPATEGLWPWNNLHFWGILFSAGLLSLGAPFWYNALKTMSSLRPVVATKAAQEQQAG